MPLARPKPCGHPGCSALVRGGAYCQAHTPATQPWAREQDRQRGSASKRGYGHRWRKARETFLLRQPLCVMCSTMERPVEATEVDHKIPHRLGFALDSGDAALIQSAQALFWDSSNWQGLCGTCHKSKTAREDGGFGNASMRRIAPPLTP